ncbi:MAG: DNA repair protein RadC [Clostridia bacterium]|nr:DNA repair protein RadC [Clostridia bacterium]
MKGSFYLSLKIKELPETERPYEKLELYGEKQLSNAELLAIIIKNGTKEETSVQIAQRILNLNDDPQMGSLGFLKNIELLQLMQIKGIGRVKAIQIKAMCEIAIRMSKSSNYKKIVIKSTEDIANLVLEEMRLKKEEVVKLFLLNTKNQILNIIDVAIGGTNFANVNIKGIIGQALKIQAPKIILVHNHPTGDSTPSKMDIQFTDKLYNATKLFEIELLDHIIIGDNNYKSVFLETKKLLKNMKNNKKEGK